MKIGIVGCGMVGATSAYALVIRGVPGCDGLTLALPHLVGGQGALATIPLPLDEVERDGLHHSADILREAIQSLKLE